MNPYEMARALRQLDAAGDPAGDAPLVERMRTVFAMLCRMDPKTAESLFHLVDGLEQRRMAIEIARGQMDDGEEPLRQMETDYAYYQRELSALARKVKGGQGGRLLCDVLAGE